MMLATFLFTNCKKYNDAEIRSSINDLKVRVERLEKLCSEMNTNISSLQAIVVALQKRDAVVSVTDLPDNKGYTILFASGKSIFIYNGKDGSDGKDGVDGQNGLDGHTPSICIKQGADGTYYWTLDGEWIVDDSGNKIKAEGANGKDGKNGTDAITPRLKIEEDYWFVSYDNGISWLKLNKATGKDGKDGKDGMDGSNITITQDKDNCYVTLPDGSVITLQKNNSTANPDIIKFADYRVKMLCVSNWDTDGDYELSKVEAAQVSNLGTVFMGDTDIFMFDELQYFTNLAVIDEDAFSGCNNLISITIPPSVREIGKRSFSGCSRLKSVCFSDLQNSKLKVISGGVTEYKDPYAPISHPQVKSIEGAFYRCYSLAKLSLPPSLQVIQAGAFYGCCNLQDVGLTAGSQLRIIEASKKILAGYNRKDTTLIVGAFEGAGLKTIFIPKSVTKLSAGVFHGCPIEEVTFEKGSVLSKFEGVFSNEFRKGNYFGVFSDLTKLKKIVIPESVTVFGDCVFKGCSSLESVVFEGKSSIQTLPGIEYQNNVDEQTIGGIFADCSSLEYISLPASIHTIGDGTFYNCVNLKTVEFEDGSQLKYIRSYDPGKTIGAFDKCINLRTIRMGTIAPPELQPDNSSYYLFDDISVEKITLLVPEGSSTAYSNVPSWRRFIIKEYYN